MTKDYAIEMLEHCMAEYRCVDYKYRNCHKCNQRIAQDMAIEALKTESIPVDWMQQWFSNQGGRRIGKIIVAETFNRMLEDWRRKEYGKL